MRHTIASSASKCLIGHTGFVGSALARQTAFDAAFNSRTIHESAGAEFDMIVCAAAPGSMFEANREPTRDAAQIDALIDQLAQIGTRRFILISSIAVLADFAGQDTEDTAAFQSDLAYGRHRRRLEAFVEDHFDDHLIVRLPALYAHGLKKNFLFDLLNPVPSMLTRERLDALMVALPAPLAAVAAQSYALDAEKGLFVLDRAALNASPQRPALDDAVRAAGASATQFHHCDTRYQFYGIDRLWADIGIASAAKLSHIHLATQPLEAARIHKALTGRAMPQTSARLHTEDMRTRHAALWGREGAYLADENEVLAGLTAFYKSENAGQRQAA